MTHDPNLVLLGGRLSNIIDITEETGDPRFFRAGIAVRLNKDDELTVAGANPFIGVSLGHGLYDYEKTSVARVGNFIPLLVSDQSAKAVVQDLLYTSKLFGDEGNAYSIQYLDLIDGDNAEVFVVNTEILVTIKSGVTRASTIKNAIDVHVDASRLVSVSMSTDSPQVEEDTIQFAGGISFWPDIGTAVRIDPINGMASENGDLTKAHYQTGRLTGMYPNRSTHPCCLIALIGGFKDV